MRWIQALTLFLSITSFYSFTFITEVSKGEKRGPTWIFIFAFKKLLNSSERYYINKKYSFWMYFDTLLKTSAPDKQPNSHIFSLIFILIVFLIRYKVS